MSFLNFIDTSFLFTLGLILLICGSVMLYCYRRLNTLENSIIEHGKILHNFIKNYNDQMMVSGMMNNGVSFMTGGNMVQSMTPNIENMDTVVNKENDGNDDDSEDDDDSDYDDVEDEDADDDDTDDDDDEHVDATDLEDNELKNDKLNITEIDSIDDTLKIKKVDNSLDIEDDVLNVNAEEIISNIDTFSDNAKIISLGNEAEDELLNEEKKNYNKLKVDELRELVVTRNITSNDEAQKYKKNELIKMLQQ